MGITTSGQDDFSSKKRKHRSVILSMTDEHISRDEVNEDPDYQEDIYENTVSMADPNKLIPDKF